MNLPITRYLQLTLLMLMLMIMSVSPLCASTPDTAQLRQWMDIIDAHRGRTFDRDTLKKYYKLYLGEMEGYPVTEDIAKVKSIRLIAEYRLSSEEYNVLAYDLIEDYRELGMHEHEVTEMYYVANKMHTAGRDGSISAYESALERLEAYRDQLPEERYCRLYMTITMSWASNYDYLGLYTRALSMLTKVTTEEHICPDSIAMMTYYRTASAIIGNTAKKEEITLDDFPQLRDRMSYFLREYVAYAEALDKPRSAALAYYNLANWYYDHEQIDTAEMYLKRSLAVDKIKWLPMQRYYSNMLLSDIELKKDNIQKSYSYLMSGQSSAQELGEPRHDFLAAIDVARWYQKTDKSAKAITTLAPMDTMMMENLDLRMKYHETMASAYESTGRLSTSLVHLKDYHLYKDSIREQNSEQQMAYLINEYDRSIQKAEITALKEENLQTQLSRQRWLGGLGGLLLLAIGGGGWYYYRQQNRELALQNERIEIEQRLFRSQMNPHFIFNTLGSIQSYLLQPGKAEDAAYYLTKFAKLMRQILSQSQYQSIPLREEVETLRIYLALQRLRFEDRFDYEIVVDDDLDVEDTYIPPMILQPLVENAIEHGQIHSVEDGRVTIRFDRADRVLAVSVTDNGVGLTASKSQNPNALKGASLATKIIQKRINYLREKYGGYIDMDIRDITTGTRVELSLPLDLH